MALVKFGTDLNLDWITRKFLQLNDPQEPARYQAELESENIIELPLEVAKRIQVDIISVVESEINEYWWENSADAEQFLVRGTTRQVTDYDTLYLQGNGWNKRTI